MLGAGPAGLGAAFRFAPSRARASLVLEREAHVGGLAGSFDVAGVRVDHGSHRLHPSTPAPIMAVLRDLLGADLQRRPRHGRIRMAQRFVAFPPHATDLVRTLPPTSLGAPRVRHGHEPVPLHPTADTFAAIVRASLGPTMADRFYAPYVEKLFGVPATELAGELARRRVGAGSAARARARVVRPNPDRGIFFYPRRGYGQISEALAAAATTRAPRSAPAPRSPRCVRPAIASRSTRRRRDDHGARLHGRRCRSRCSRGWPPHHTPVGDAGNRLETRAMVLVYLALPTAQWTPYDAHYFPERDVLVSRISEPRTTATAPTTPRRHGALRRDPVRARRRHAGRPLPTRSPPQVRDALARSDLPTPAPIDVVVRRVPRAYPVYRVGYEQPFATLDAWATALPRVLNFGRQGLFAHDNTHHTLAMAWAAADAVGDRRPRRRATWARARADFATHVVED